MPYTFGGATGDDVTWTGSNLTLGSNLTALLVAGWWYPTTLTAGRGLWSRGNTIGATIAATTSELIVKSDNTTDGQWTTSGLSFTVNEWRFLAFLLNVTNTGPAGGVNVWAGRDREAPTAVSVSASVAPSGNFTGNSSTTVGNVGTATTAFQGDIAHVCTLGSSGSADNLALMGVVTDGSLSSDEISMVERRFIFPLWKGEYAKVVGRNRKAWDSFAPLDTPWAHRPAGTTGTGLAKGVLQTVNGAALAANNRCPRDGLYNAIDPGIPPAKPRRR